MRGGFAEFPQTSKAITTQRIPLGTILEITPNISDISTSPIRQTLAWMGELEEVTFRLRYRGGPDQSTPSSGFIDITASGLLIARIPVAIAINMEISDLRLNRTSAEMIRRVFASYSRKDEAIVRACKAAYRALAIQLFIDKDEILTGQKWRSVIRQRIADHQLFQLYWSKYSAESSEVANEWQIALEIAPQRTADFIQPVFWSKPMVSLPAELANLNFGFLDLAALSVARERIPEEAATGPVLVDDLQRTFPIFKVARDNAGESDRLRRDLSRIVPWLESLISIRYYPPATFLVDEHAIRTVKAVFVPEQPTDGTRGDSVALEHAIDLLQSLALAFPVGSLLGEQRGASSERNAFFGAVNEPEKTEYEHVVRMAEYLFSGPVREFTKGQDVFGRSRESFEKVLREVASGGDSGWDLAHLIEQLLSLASASDRQVIEGLVSKNNIEDLRSFTTGKSAAAASKIAQTQVAQLAAKYGAINFFGQPDRTQLRVAPSFPIYVRSFCDQWLTFIDVALQRRGNTLTQIGYDAPEDALRWLERKLPNLHISRRPRQSWQKTGRTLYELGLRDYRACVAFLSDVLIHELEQALPGPVIRYISTMTHTFGVFIQGDSVKAQKGLENTLRDAGWPAEASISGQDKVLVCLSTLERVKAEMREAGTETAAADSLVDRLALAVLVHEHFHSAVARGLDRQGHASMGIRTADAWNNATGLNESLAAWTERHFLRDDPEMVAHLDAYIQHGQYPNWPYAGAIFIESEYKRGGLPAARTWMHYLRDDPENAQADFDRCLAKFRAPG